MFIPLRCLRAKNVIFLKIEWSMRVCVVPIFLNLPSASGEENF